MGPSGKALKQVHFALVRLYKSHIGGRNHCRRLLLAPLGWQSKLWDACMKPCCMSATRAVRHTVYATRTMYCNAQQMQPCAAAPHEAIRSRSNHPAAHLPAGTHSCARTGQHTGILTSKPHNVCIGTTNTPFVLKSHLRGEPLNNQVPQGSRECAVCTYSISVTTKCSVF